MENSKVARAIKQKLAAELRIKALHLLDEDKLIEAKCYLQIAVDLDPSNDQTKLFSEVQAQIEEREKLSEHEVLKRMENKIAAVTADITHAQQQASRAKSEEEQRMIEQQMEILRNHEERLKYQLIAHEEKQKDLQLRETNVSEREQQVNQQAHLLSEQTRQLEKLLSELGAAFPNEAIVLQQQMQSVTTGDKDVDAARLRFESMQKQVKKAQDALILEERRQRERVELLQKQMELYRSKGMSPAQLAFRNFLKDVKRLSSVRNKIEHTPHPLRVFISYAWETDKDENKQLQQRLQQLKDDLEVAGMDVKLDIRNMKADMKQFMIDEITKAHKLLLICTPRLKVRATDATKNNLQLELENAVEKAKTDPGFIVPLLFSGTFGDAIPLEVSNLLAVNCTSQIPQEYYATLAARAPLGLIPMLLGVEDSKEYRRIHDRLFLELAEYL